MNELILHAGIDKVSLTVVGQAHRERQTESNTEQMQPWVTLVGEEWDVERGTQVNRIMKQTLRQMNIIQRYITANKDESAPSGWKTCPTTKKNKAQNLLTYFFNVLQRWHRTLCSFLFLLLLRHNFRFLMKESLLPCILYCMLPWVFCIYLKPSMIKPSTSFKHCFTILSDY